MSSGMKSTTNTAIKTKITDNNPHSALLIIDVQYDFLPGGALAVPKGDEVISIINELQYQFPLVVATQDWHPQGHSSFASQHEGYSPFEVIEWRGMSQTLWPDHCLQGSKGAQIADTLDQAPIEAIIRKGMDIDIDSYSGFYDNGHKKSTGLASYLQEKGVDTVYCCGLAADVCVYYTAYDAAELGFETYFIEQATRSIDANQYAQVKQRLQAVGVHFLY